MNTILICDDEKDWCESLKAVLVRNTNTIANDIVFAHNKNDAVKILEHSKIDIVLLDLVMPDVSGEDVLEYISHKHPNVITVIMSGMNNFETAIRCMQMGAVDYITKSMQPNELVARLQKVIELAELKSENDNLRKYIQAETLHDNEKFKAFKTANPRIKSLFKYAEAVAQGSQPILITGESGVGKGIFAKIIHELSRADKPYVSLNIAGLDNHMFNDTLFGHIKGAFTGADKDRTGLIQEADNGTIFLDEIGELDTQSQVKLLNLIQDREYRKLGKDSTLRTNARFVFATNQNLLAKQEDASFRKDLYYRLSTHIIHLPPLRERKEDIPILINHFISEASTEFNKPNIYIDLTAMNMLENYSFPGNARQLRAMVYDLVANNQTGVITIEEITASNAFNAENVSVSLIGNEELELSTIDAVIAKHVLRVMEICDNNQTKAAHILGITQSALSRKLRKIK